MIQLTVKDILNRVTEIKFTIKLLGCSGTFQEAFQEKMEKIGRTVCEENNLKYGKLGAISLETKLGEKSTLLLEELCEWFETQ